MSGLADRKASTKPWFRTFERGDLFDDRAEAVPQVRVRAAVGHDCPTGTEFIGEGFVDEQVLRREPTVEGCQAHLGATGDVAIVTSIPFSENSARAVLAP
jgi:hypothetical protein